MTHQLPTGMVVASIVWVCSFGTAPLVGDTGHVLIDLERHANDDLLFHFRTLKPGPIVFDGVPFQVLGKRVRVTPGEKRLIDLPQTTCAGFHFLHYQEMPGHEIGAYVITFVDDQQARFPLVGGQNIDNWWYPAPLTFAAVAHTDTFKKNEQPMMNVGFWRLSAPNPRPNATLTSLEIVNSHASACINVIAVTFSEEFPQEILRTPVFDPTMLEEQRLIAVLGMHGPPRSIGSACERLRQVGTAKCIPALAPLLANEQLSFAARFALESMPYPEAGDALRDAVAATAGKTKVGIIESLGERADPQSVPVLSPLLVDSDRAIAGAAAVALGKIAGSEAVKALQKAQARAEPAMLPAVHDGLLRAARDRLASQRQEAHQLYRHVYESAGPNHVRMAAYRGMILSAGEEALALVCSALTENDRAARQAATKFVRDLPGSEATVAFAALLGKVSPDVQLALIKSLGQRGDPAAAPAVATALSNPDEVVRGAAFRALSLIGDRSVLPVLTKASATAEAPDRKAARTTLTRLKGAAVDRAMLNHLDSAPAAEQAELAWALGERGRPGSVPALLRLVHCEEAQVRSAAIKSLGKLATAQDAGTLVELAGHARTKEDRDGAEGALISMGLRTGTPPEYVEPVLAALKDDAPELRCAMLRVCGKLHNDRLMNALGEATTDGNETVRDIAVRALGGSPDAEALPHLLRVARHTSNPQNRILALRGLARLARDTSAPEAMLRDAIALAQRPAEKKLLLGVLGHGKTLDTLKCVQGHLTDADVMAEAAAACVQICKSIQGQHGQDVRAACKFVLQLANMGGIPQDLQIAVTEILASTPPPPASAENISFERIIVDRQFRSEGVAVADVNQDGSNDILAGDVWYAAPDWQVHEIRPPGNYDPENAYSECFANFASDVDGDGWLDSIIVGFPGGPARWYRNPGGATGHWKPHQLASAACGETPIFGDLLGDGRPVPVFALNLRFTWFRPRQDLTSEWEAFPVTQELPEFERYGHGMGMGDVNSDGRIDLVGTDGWWEAPMDRTQPDWTFHEASLGPDCADMFVYDVDGDGDSDIVTSSAHGYGIWWFEQSGENGNTTFKQHEIDKSISQTHAMCLADINGDGLRDLVTGKRYRAHGGHDPGTDEPGVLFWLELRRPADGQCEFRFHEIDSDSGVGTQFQVCDVDGDGLLDVVTSNKKGVYVFLQRRSG